MPENRYRNAAAFRAELRRFLRRSEDWSRHFGITPRQHLLLLQIAGADNRTTTVSDLVGSLSLTQSAVTELVQRAEVAGLVDRTPSREDGRVVHLSLTPRQHVLLLQIAAAPDGTTTVSDLVTKLALSQSAVTELVQRAEAAGLVQRAGSKDDARVVHLSLTGPGAEKLAAVHEALGPERTHLKRVIDGLA